MPVVLGGLCFVVSVIWILNFVLVSDFVLRISNFVEGVVAESCMVV